MMKDFRHRNFKTQNPTIKKAPQTDVKNDDSSSVKVFKYGRKEWLRDRLKESIAIIIVAFLWLLRITFIPSLLIVGATWFATNMIPTMAVQVFASTGLTSDSLLVDQFAFFYLPMIAFVFIFGLVTVVLVCYTEYKFWMKCGSWIKIWFKRTGIKNPFKKNKEMVTK